MSGPRPDPPIGGRADAIYTAALQLARRRGLSLTQSALTKLETAIRNALRTILPAVTDAALRTPVGAATLRATVAEALDELERTQQAITQHATTLVITDVTALHRQATVTLASAVGRDDLEQLVRVALGSAPARALATLAERPRKAASFVTLIKRGMADAGPQVDRLLSSAIAHGVDAGTLARDLRTLLNGGTPVDLRRTYGLTEPQIADARSLAYDARRIAVSETNNALREANRQSLLDAGIVEAAQWQLSGRHSLEDECDDLAETDFYGYGPGYYPIPEWPMAPHPFCVPGDTIISGRVQAGFRAHYRGDVITFRTRHGNTLAVTPNHPVLTATGVVPAHAIREGDQLLRHCGDAEPERVPLVGHKHNAPATIEQVIDFLRETGGSAHRDRQADYLYGETDRMHGEIEVVGANRLRWHDDESAPTEREHDLVLVPSAIAESSFGRERASELALERIGLATTRRVRRSDLTRNTRRIALERLPMQSTRIGEAAHLDAVLSEPARENAAAYADFARQMQERHAGAIAVDEVIEIGHRDFDGHVYDLTTETGYFTASSILISNCACTQGGPVIYRPVADWGTPNTAETARRLEPSELPARAGASPAATARRQRVLTAALARAAHSGGPNRSPRT